MVNLLSRLGDVPSTSLAGKAVRLPLRLIPRGTQVPIVQGPLKGYRWVVASGNHSCWLGIYERHKQAIFAANIKPGAIVFDVGAHAGFYTLLFSRLVGAAGSVFAFEPSESNLAFLHKHLKLNRIVNVEVINAAVSEVSGTGHFEEGISSYNGRLTTSGAIAVRTVRLDDLCMNGAVPLPNYIKIDVEGAEDSVLAGASATIRDARPIIFLATHGSDLDASCVRQLTAMGYRLDPIAGDPLEWRELIARPNGDPSLGITDSWSAD